MIDLKELKKNLYEINENILLNILNLFEMILKSIKIKIHFYYNNILTFLIIIKYLLYFYSTYIF